MANCKTCGHDVNGPPPPDVKREAECFPCLAGRSEKRVDELRGLLGRCLARFETETSWLDQAEKPEYPARFMVARAEFLGEIEKALK
jgi:hypothetical protein